VRVSDDGTSWRPVYSTAAGDGDVDILDVSAAARYVRLQLTARGTGWGYSLHELGIYG
jgi:hypothetical protein